MTAAAPGFELGDVYVVGLLLGGVVLIGAIVALSQQSDRAFTAAAVYLVIGAAVAAGADAFGVELLEPIDDATLIEHLAEIAVIIALFGAGLRVDRPLRWGEWDATVRLIGIVMPLTMIAVAFWAGLVMGLSLGAAILLAAVLAPTDPVLANDVQVGPPGDPDESEPHFALTSEAGLNDGLAFPFVFGALFIAAEGGTGWLAEWALADVLYAIAGGALIGAGVGYALGHLTSQMRERDWFEPSLDAWLAIAVVLIVYGASEALGAYGFIAAFVGGLAFRRQELSGAHHERVHGGAEMIENVTELALVLLVGAMLTLSGLEAPGLAGWLLVPLLLFVIRPAATLLGFVGARLPLRERLFIGWFGIRGIGTLYYVAIAVGSGVLSGDEQDVVVWTALACIVVSIVVHGLTVTQADRRMRAVR